MGPSPRRAPFLAAPRRPRVSHASRIALSAPTSARLSGPGLAAVHHLSSLPVTGEVVRALTMEVLGMRALARLPAEVRGELPDIVEPRPARAPRRWSDARLAVPRPSGWPRCSRDYVDAYAAGRTTPERVAERAGGAGAVRQPHALDE